MESCPSFSSAGRRMSASCSVMSASSAAYSASADGSIFAISSSFFLPFFFGFSSVDSAGESKVAKRSPDGSGVFSGRSASLTGEYPSRDSEMMSIPCFCSGKTMACTSMVSKNGPLTA